MAALGAQSIASSYEQLLHVDRDGGGNTTTHVSIKDGDNGTTFGFTIASDALMMSSTNRLEFGDTGTYIHQSADGVLDLVSDTEIELTATTIDLNGAVAMDGAMTGGTNITISGELDAATLDISGDADIDGTLEADAITVNGTALATFIRDTVGTNMLSSNSESGITVTYDTTNDNIDFAVDAAQTGITSLLAADIKIGEDNETKIDFETANEIHLYANNTEQVYVADNIFGPESDSDVDLGATGVRWKDAFVDSITVTGEVDAATLDISGAIDVAGTANLDIVDIDGAVDMATTLQVTGAVTASGGMLLNGTTPTLTVGDGGAEDAKILFDGNAQNFHIGLDDTNDKLTIGLGNVLGTTTMITIDENGKVVLPDNLMEISTSGNEDNLTLTSTDADANSGPNLRLYRNSASPANDDVIGQIDFEGKNNAGSPEDVVYATLKSYINDRVDGSEAGQITLEVMNGSGALAEAMRANNSATVFNEGGVDRDFRVESDGNANMLFVDGGNNKVGVGTSTVDSTFHAQASENTAFDSSDAGLQFGLGATLAIKNNSDTNNSFSQLVLRQRASGQCGARIVSSTSATNTADLNFIVEDGNTMVKAIQVDPSGEVLMPKTPAFQVTNSSDPHANYAINTDITLTWGSEVFDQGANFASNTFTAPVTGKYQFNVNFYIQSVDTDAAVYTVRILTSNRTYTHAFQGSAFAADNTFSLHPCVLADMDASDTCYIQFHQSGGAAQSDVVTQAHFSGYLAC